MKLTINIFIAIFFSSTLSFGQIKVSQTDLQEVMMFSEQGQTEKANDKINSLRKAVTVKDSFYIYLIMTSGEMNMKVNNCEAAIVDLEEIIQLVPSTEIDCQTHIARFKKYLGDFDGALTAYKRILKLDPKEELTFNNMASAYVHAGKYQDAVNVLNSNPNTERLSSEFYHYAIAYFNLNKLDSAKLNIDIYLKTERAEQDYYAYKVAAQIYSALSNNEKSCEYITKANDIIKSTKPNEEISKMSTKVQGYYFIKEQLKQIEETKNLHSQLCQ